MTTVEARDARLVDQVVPLPPRERPAGQPAPEAPATAPAATILEQLIRREAAARSLGC